MAATPVGWQPIADHPRPSWARPWVSLDGPWHFGFDPKDAGLANGWPHGHEYSNLIQVPFPWQSALSGLAATEYHGVAWYEREVAIPPDAGPRVFVVFGAADWHAQVWVNGEPAGEHTGGYTPFEVELTRFAQPGDTVRLTLRVDDPTDPEQATGKQIGWYTPTGGIWQSVYLESRGAAYLDLGHITPDIDAARATVRCRVQASRPGTYTVRAVAQHGTKRHEATAPVALDAAGAAEAMIDLPIPDPALWSPDDPNLYTAELSLEAGGEIVDRVHTYFGMRKVSRGTYGGSEHEYILLNNEPVYLRGALHQSFNPQGLYTHPDDAFIRRDYELAKSLGLNFIRIHIKAEEPRALYWADRLGVLLMCDMPNFWKKSGAAKAEFERMLDEVIARDYNHPSIIAWCNFNETWGIGDGGYDAETQQWVHAMYKRAKALDPTRLVEDNSPCFYDHTETDINSWHFYIEDYEKARNHIQEVVDKTYPGSTFNCAEGWTQSTAPLINSEYGGISAGSGDRDISWVFLHLTNLLRKHDKIVGYVYTELSDIEWEHNGFVNYDRSPKTYGYPAGITVRDLQGAEFPVLDCPPYRVAEAGSSVDLPVLFSHWSTRTGLKLRVSAHGHTTDGRPWNTLVPIREHILGDAEPFRVTPAVAWTIDLPEANGLLNLVVEILDGDKRLAANFCVVHVSGAEAWPGAITASVPVRDVARTDYPEAGIKTDHDKVYGYGPGFIEYAIALPPGLNETTIESAKLVAEVGSKARDERHNWPMRRHPQDYPQTDEPAWPTDVRIAIDGVPLATVHVPNDFADARGVLSHVAGWHHGSHGVRVECPLTGAALEAVRAAAAEGRPVTLRFETPGMGSQAGGLALYGAGMGAYPIDPALVFNVASTTGE